MRLFEVGYWSMSKNLIEHKFINSQDTDKRLYMGVLPDCRDWKEK